jgi:TolA-binding protein
MKPRRNRAGWRAALRLALLMAAVAGSSAATGPPAAPGRIEQLNQRFMKHLESLAAEHALAAESVRRGYQEGYGGPAARGFVPDALAVLYPQYREALEAFDRDRYAEARRLLEPLRVGADPFLAANATYFYMRSLAGEGLMEELEQALGGRLAEDPALEDFTPLAPHLWFLLACAQWNNLRYAAAAETLRQLAERFPDAPEAVQSGAGQLRLELERRERGTLGEVAQIMVYSADRLRVADAGLRVREQQGEVIRLLDDLIEEARSREQPGAGGGGSRRGGRGPRGQVPPSTPGAPAERSEVTPGEGRVGALHGAPQANPGEMWGRMPPSERERILQSLRDRFPSRYRQLVEQYYRSLSEQK